MTGRSRSWNARKCCVQAFLPGRCGCGLRTSKQFTNLRMSKPATSSSSQLKEQSMWLVCAERGWSVDSMRDKMGDFSMCESPSKYAARVGQCFSTTVTISTSHRKRNDGLRVKDDLPDIPSSIESLVHSDGCGLIRHEVLLKSVLPLVPYAPRFKSDISAIQFRCGGAKGVLVGWDFDKLGIRNHDVCLRPSQVSAHALVIFTSRLNLYEQDQI